MARMNKQTFIVNILIVCQLDHVHNKRSVEFKAGKVKAVFCCTAWDPLNLTLNMADCLFVWFRVCSLTIVCRCRCVNVCLPWWFSDVCTVGSRFTCQVYSTGWVRPVPLTGRGICVASSWLVWGKQPTRACVVRSVHLVSPPASCLNHILLKPYQYYSYCVPL